jgi:hypothetical protein
MQAENREPTIADVLVRLDQIDLDVKATNTKVDATNTKVDAFNQRFSDYQQATQWVVQLAFTLIASATITVIVTAIFKR